MLPTLPSLAVMALPLLGVMVSAHSFHEDKMETRHNHGRHGQTPDQALPSLSAQNIADGPGFIAPWTPISEYLKLFGWAEKEDASVSEKHDTILDVLTADRRFTHIVDVIHRFPDIADRLSDPGLTLTFLAPTDDAFKDLVHHPNTSDKVIEQILNYHIIPAIVPTKELVKHYSIESSLPSDHLDGENVRLRIVPLTPTRMYINYAYLVEGNIEADNGLVHAVNHYLFPPPPALGLLYMFPERFSTLTSAIAFTGLEKTFAGLDASTIFAPTNQAFSRLGRHALAFLFSPRGKGIFRKTLLYHVSPELHYIEDALAAHTIEIPTLLKNQTLSVEAKEALHWVLIAAVNSKANIRFADLPSHNAAIHIIDQVLIPHHDRHVFDALQGDHTTQSQEGGAEEVVEDLFVPLFNGADGDPSNAFE